MSLSLMKKKAAAAKAASASLASLSVEERNSAIRAMARQIREDSDRILTANRADMREAEEARLSAAMLGRLRLDAQKIVGMVKGLETIAALPDPLGRELETITRPNGLKIRKISVPIGVILIIFESRPNVTADCAGLCVKSGNAVILRGGREAIRSNTAIHASISAALKKRGISPSAVEFIESTDRKDVEHLLSLAGDIDVVIPRGGPSLMKTVTEKSKIPVLKHLDGICHTYVDRDADPAMAVRICENAKAQNPGVCNAMETLLVDRPAAAKFLPFLAQRMKARGVELRGCPETRKILKGIKSATEQDWKTEYLDLVLSIRVVNGVEAAAAHIRKYGSKHSDAIVSENASTRARFASAIDSACVFENCSTRFNDGGEFGMGAEMGISTDKLHARGPVGLRELTTYQYIVSGRGQIRE
ncbi:MAG: glutamate-5-semialdehyde dehydrogenase [Candidatus Omnitrophica bacterium]|jgi:glutamate-5-semialdehyde dehydrogenase|nr:glutamate-5-semialdehyde dehydrogenase [Candidatus Omnitrophota bacterium]